MTNELWTVLSLRLDSYGWEAEVMLTHDEMPSAETTLDRIPGHVASWLCGRPLATCNAFGFWHAPKRTALTLRQFYGIDPLPLADDEVPT